MSDEGSGGEGESDSDGDNGTVEENEEESGSNYDTTSDSSELYMSVYRGRDEDNYDDSELEEMVEEAVSRGIISREEAEESEIVKKPWKARETLDYLHEILDEYYDHPDKYASLKTFLAGKGYSLKDPTHEGVFDDRPHAIAKTNAINTLEANIDLYEKIRQLASDCRLTHSEAEELVLTHELVHLAQPDHIKRGVPVPYIAEIDAELTLTQYFLGKAREEGGRQESYRRMGEAAYSRALMIYHVMTNEKKMNFNNTCSDTLVQTNTYSSNTLPLEKTCNRCYHETSR